MNKIKKIISSIGVFIVSSISKVYAKDSVIRIDPMYGVDPGPKETAGNILLRMGRILFLKIGKIAFPVILLFIGLFVILNKKITKKIKVIVVSALIIYALLSVILIDYILTNM